jgi:hypothetical protein
VLNYRGGPVVVNAGRVTYRGLVDIASNGIGIRPGDDERAFETRLRQGVADTVAEILTLSSDVHLAENTASVFSRLASEGSRGLLVAAHDQAAVGALPWPQDEAMRVGADIDAGFMAVVPRKAVKIDGIQHVGWWRVHPLTGETIGVMDTGFHGGNTAPPAAARNCFRAGVTGGLGVGTAAAFGATGVIALPVFAVMAFGCLLL